MARKRVVGRFVAQHERGEFRWAPATSRCGLGQLRARKGGGKRVALRSGDRGREGADSKTSPCRTWMLHYLQWRIWWVVSAS